MSTTRKIVLIISSIVLALVLIVVVGIAIIASAFGGKRPSIEGNSARAARRQFLRTSLCSGT